MKKVLITGATGFIGSNLAAKLVEQKTGVRCLVRNSSSLRRIEGLPVDLVYGDLGVSDSLEPAVQGVDAVIHLAGKTKARSDEEFYTVNSAGTLNLLKAVARCNPSIKQFIYMSSIAAAGPGIDRKPVTASDLSVPISSYGASKLAGEEAVQAFVPQIPVTILRPGIVFGPGDADGLSLFKIIAAGIRPSLGFGNRYYSFIYVDDLVQAVINALGNTKAVDKTIFLASYPEVSWNEFMSRAAGSLGKRTIPVFIPVAAAYAIAVASELLSNIRGSHTIVNRQKVVEMKQRYWVCDTADQEKILGVNASVPLEQAVDSTVSWYRSQGWL